MKKTNQIITIVIGIIIAIGIIIFAKTQQNMVAPAATDENIIHFSAANYNEMHVDTFINLVQKTYNPFVQQEKNNGNLIISITQQENVGKDFFNGNKDLLEFGLNDFGFKIEQQQNNTTATFKITNGGVNVPNDVLINIAAKLKK